MFIVDFIEHYSMGNEKSTQFFIFARFLTKAFVFFVFVGKGSLTS